MILVMFDVDGTLTESFDLDSATYLDALREVFGFCDVSDDWAAYPHVTDGGILAEVFQSRLGRPPIPPETEAMRSHFAALLATRIHEADGIRPVAGAVELLAQLSEKPDAYAVAYASGGWGMTARLKLRSAGLPVDGIPGAFADDNLSREGICRTAHRRAQAQRGYEMPTVIYVGDGIWDVRTSRRLGYGFIGIGRDIAKLCDEGATKVFPDFRDADAFLAAIKLLASLRSGETAAPAR